ncbi:Xylanase/chitin deacetylase, NodB [Romboutsia ilealis]|uniref:Xylanase/chitin deacetylase, NodB n=1 Tax=Romboutsia ilealis TaxID=1115758 RepID=A0A1V1I274_9FIRM|nr:polysaccharide deacetylase family protein [Romboutsia ilealis]CED94243.1 Xylanase/chitin deacetylase, NodB [Romboutsia ilealis]
MRRKNKIKFSSKKRKKGLDVKKCALLVVVLVVLIAVGFKGVTATTAFIEEKRQEKIEMQKKAEAERLEEERKRKEEEEAKKKMVGVTHEAKQYTYDARKIQEKLANYDYSNNGKKMVFLTFDDGSSTTVTPEILKALKENDVRATFFVTGENIERGGQKAKDLIKESFEYGNAIANHSYTHDYKVLYPGRTLNLDNFLADFNKTDELLKEILGPYFSTRVIRCPGGHMSWKGMDQLDNYLDENNMASIDWNALIADAEGKKKNAQELLDYAINTSQGKDIVVLLMHDTYGKEETAKALPTIIKYFKDNGYEFKTLS